MLEKIFVFVVSLVFVPIKHLFKRGRIVVLQARSSQVYCDNTKYIYEYLSNEKDIDAYWVTDNPEIQKHISDNGWKYITKSNPIKMIWVALRVRVLVDNGDGFFNIFNITSPKSVIKICVGHGSGPKATLARTSNIKDVTQQILNINKFNYVNFPSQYFSELLGKMTYFLPNEKILTLGYPRCDALFDDRKVKKANNEKRLTKLLNPSIKSTSKVVLYTPTWRPYKYNFPLSEMHGFSFEDFDQWLFLNNLIFFYTVHANLFPENIPNNLGRVIFINSNNNPLFDVNEFMLEVDILVNDYSTTSTDFSILNRPQIFYMPDYEYYSSEKCFLESYRDMMPGHEVFSYDDFKSILLRASLEPESYVKEDQDTISKLQKKYYNIQHQHSIRSLSEFILRLL